MIFAIHPAQLEFIEKIARGDKIVYHQEMSILCVFANDFKADARGPNWINHPITSAHFVDMLYSLEIEIRHRRVVGVQFWSAKPILEIIHSSRAAPIECTAELLMEKCLEYATSEDHERLKNGIEQLRPVIGQMIIPQAVIREVLDHTLQ